MAGTAPGNRYQSRRQAQTAGTAPARGSRTSGLAPASWLLAGVALLLVGVLTYYLTLTTRPEIAEISPAPNSSQIPGVVDLEARVNSQRSVAEAVFIVDGEEVATSIEQEEDNRWRVHHAQIFERGDRNVVLQVTDSSGRTAEHSWSFEAGGDLIQPRLVLASPPPEALLEPGLNGIVIQSTTFADIEEIVITFDGEQVDTDVEELDAGTEYSNQDDLPVYEWHIRASERLGSGSTSVVAEITDEFGATASSEWTIRIAEDEESADALYFDQSGEYITEPFLSYWQENSGQTTIGPPVSPLIADENGEQQQFFRYARLELDDDGEVHRGLIGREMFGEPENPPDRSPGSGARQFDATGHYITGTIRQFWEENGGLSTFGYPVSQEFETDEGYGQYFERALIEVIVIGSYELVELAPLGERIYESQLREQSVGEMSDDS